MSGCGQRVWCYHGYTSGDSDSIAVDTDIEMGGEMVETKKRTKSRKKDTEDVPLTPNPASWGLGMDAARAKVGGVTSMWVWLHVPHRQCSSCPLMSWNMCTTLKRNCGVR